jgi:hypothetical protein
MGFLQEWWRKRKGKGPEATVRTRKPTARKAPRAGELELADEPEPKKPGQVGAGGMDPYSSDAGYAKPHSWERVDHD